MTEPSYHKQRARHERDLAETVARETVEILFGGNEEPSRRGGCIIAIIAIIATAAVYIVALMTTVTMPSSKITIQIARRGHFYFYSRWRGDDLEVDSAKVGRETADTVIRHQSGGLLPAGVNFDVVHPRSWIWKKEVFENV